MSKISISAEVARILKSFMIFSPWRTPDQSLSKYLSYLHFHERSRANLLISPGISKIGPFAVQRPDVFQWTLEYERNIKFKALFVYGQRSGKCVYPTYLWLDKNFVFMWIQDVYPSITTLSSLDFYFMYSIQTYYLLFL